MRKIDKPDFNIKDVVNRHHRHFYNRFRNSEDKLTDFEDFLIQKESIYLIKAQDNRLAYTKSIYNNHLFTLDEIESSYDYVYSSKMFFRKKIIELAEGRCPLCDSIFGYGNVELDHILPKKHFYNYTIIPQNLVPICTSCNRAKGEKYGTTLEGVLNPYYNEYPLQELLEFDIITQGQNISIKINILAQSFFFKKYAGSDSGNSKLANDYRKIQYHFNLHKISSTLEMKANTLITSGIILTISQVHVLPSSYIELERILFSLKNHRIQKYIDDEFLKDKIIETLLSKKRDDIYDILLCKIEDESKKKRIEMNLINV